MAFSGNNQLIYNAAFNGAMAGMMAGRPITDATTADYAAYGNVATAWATEVDSLIVTDAQLAAAGATVPPTTAAETAAQQAKAGFIHQLSHSYWQGRDITGASTVAANYSVAATAVFHAYSEAVAQYALAPGGTSLS